MTASSGTPGKKNRPSRQRGGPVQPVRLHECTKLSNVTLFVFGLKLSRSPVSQKTSNLPRRCGLSPLFLSFRLKFSLFRVAFICIRVEIVSPSSSCHPFSVNPIPLDAMGRYTVGLTSSFSFSEGKGKSFCCLFQMICRLKVDWRLVTI